MPASCLCVKRTFKAFLRTAISKFVTAFFRAICLFLRKALFF